MTEDNKVSDTSTVEIRETSPSTDIPVLQSPIKKKELDDKWNKYNSCLSHSLYEKCKSLLPTWFISTTSGWD